MKRYQRILIKVSAIIGGLVLAYFILGEIFATNAHAKLEKQMRANFETQLCESATGNVCDDAPLEGRCISGDYIDYRTVFGRHGIVGVNKIEEALLAKTESVGSLREMVNWLACVGFSKPRIGYFDEQIKYGGPGLPPESSKRYWENIRLRVPHTLAAYAPLQLQQDVWFIAPFLSNKASVLSIKKNTITKKINVNYYARGSK